MVFLSEQREHHQHHRRCSVLLQKIAGEQRTWPACPNLQGAAIGRHGTRDEGGGGGKSELAAGNGIIRLGLSWKQQQKYEPAHQPSCPSP
ncbi:uncharacterized protein RHO25_010789 [Cercospora beticola]|uniref:Uncharacterized protein n=1 Tax=Cercospora beticola TaxID=122368 RepID=A0ABZ0P2R7_CERBT|nr:hypothetical protein RHO25_010789 [Cercospora beticola]